MGRSICPTTSCCQPTGDNRGGMSRIVLLTLGTLAWVFSVITLTTCTFIRNGENNMYSDMSKGFGLFGVEVDGVCENYMNNKTEGAHSAAKGFGILTSLSLGAAVISAFLATCLLMGSPRRLPNTWRCSRIFFGLALVSSLLTMLMFAGPYKNRVCLQNGDCKPGLGAGLNIANILLLAGLTALSCCTAPPTDPNEVQAQAEEVFEVSAENNKDVEAQDRGLEIGSEVDGQKSFDTRDMAMSADDKSANTSKYSKVDNDVVSSSPCNPCAIFS